MELKTKIKEALVINLSARSFTKVHKLEQVGHTSQLQKLRNSFAGFFVSDVTPVPAKISHAAVPKVEVTVVPDRTTSLLHTVGTGVVLS